MTIVISAERLSMQCTFCNWQLKVMCVHVCVRVHAGGKGNSTERQLFTLSKYIWLQVFLDQAFYNEGKTPVWI